MAASNGFSSYLRKTGRKAENPVTAMPYLSFLPILPLYKSSSNRVYRGYRGTAQGLRVAPKQKVGRWEGGKARLTPLAVLSTHALTYAHGKERNQR